MYQGRVISAKANLSKQGDKRIIQMIAPVDASGNTRRPNVVLITKLPSPTSPEVFAHFGLPAIKEDGSPMQEAIPNTAYDLWRYCAATRPELAPALPYFDTTTKKWLDASTDVTYSNKSDKGLLARKAELMTPSYTFFEETFANLVNDPEAKDTIQDEFVFELSYRPGNDFPNVKILGSECPDDKVLITDLSNSTELVDG